MKNRKRNKEIRFYVTDEELAIINRRAKDAGFLYDRSAFLRKNAIDLHILKLDLSPLITLAISIDKIGTNINQIARKINSTNQIENQDIKTLQIQMNSIQEKMDKMFDKYLKIKDPSYRKRGEKD